MGKELESIVTLNQSRRDFLRLGAALASSAILEPAVLLEAFAQVGTQQTNSQRWDISYLWDSDIDVVLDYKGLVGELLGPSVERDLRVVRRGKLFGLIYDRNGDFISSRRVAAVHDGILRANDFDDGAVTIRDEGYNELFNVSYGLGPNLNELKRRYSLVQARLGPEVGKNLFIEETDSDNYVLVYRRRGDIDSTREVAERHTRILRSTGIFASYTREQNNEVVYGSSSKANEDVEGSPGNTVKPPKRKPESPPEKKPKPIPGRKPAPPREVPQPTSNLESRIESQMEKERKNGRLASDERTAWSVYDFTTGDKLVSVNEDAPMQCASMMKPFVALGIQYLVRERKLSYTREIQKDMGRMIQKSNNAATNRLIARIGGPRALQKILKTKYGDIFQQTSIVESIPRGGATYRNKASAHDYGRFLYALFNGDLPGSAEIRRLMGLPGRDRVYTGAVEVPSGTGVINKTGSTARLCGDMAILYAKGKDGKAYAYTLVGIIEKGRRASNYSSWINSKGNVIRRASNTVYDFMQRRHNLI